MSGRNILGRRIGFTLLLSAALTVSGGAVFCDEGGSTPGTTGDGGPKVSLARFVVSHMKLKQGLGLDVGCGDAGLAVEVARQTKLVIHCLDPDAKTISRARAAIDRAGLYGEKLVANTGSLDVLNYPDNSANLIVCGGEFVEGKGTRDFKEICRVLSPNGIAFIGQSVEAAKGGRKLTRAVLEGWLKEAGIETYTLIEENGVWARITRPFSPGWDEWTHRNHDPANTLSSRDTLPYGGYRTQWVRDFSPSVSSASIAVGGGRIVYAGLSYDYAPATTPYIQVLDAFSGVELWSRVGAGALPIERAPSLYANRGFCSDIAVMGDSLYLLGGKQCHVFDLETGKIERSVAVPPEAEPDEQDVWLYMSCLHDTLYGGVGRSPENKVDWNTTAYRGISKALFAMDRNSDGVKWMSHIPVFAASITVGDDALHFVDDELRLHALDRKTGKERWNASLEFPSGTAILRCAEYRGRIWVLYVLPQNDKKGKPVAERQLYTGNLMNARRLDAFSAKDGRRLFACDFGEGVTIANFTFSGDRLIASRQHASGVFIVDVETGKLKHAVRAGLKCTPAVASPNSLFFRGRQTHAVDLASLGGSPKAKPKETIFSGFRPTCLYPAIPAYGRLYIPAPGCKCSTELRINICLEPGVPGTPKEIAAGSRTVAHGQWREDESRDTVPVIWAGWRGNRLRSGIAGELAGPALKETWRAECPGPLTAFAVGYGMLYFGSDRCRLYALDSATGTVAWQFITDGGIRAAPYLWNRAVYVGDDEGWVYCVRAETGELIWRFRAALNEDRMVGYGNFMSRWPVRSGVVVGENTAYFGAGMIPVDRSAVYAVDARTGKQQWQKVSGLIPGGSMVLTDGDLYIPSPTGRTRRIEVKQDVSSKKKKSTRIPMAGAGRGPHIMMGGDALVGAREGYDIVWHLQYMSVGGAEGMLPIVDGETMYLLNHQVSGKEKVRHLAAVRKETYLLDTRTGKASNSILFNLKKDLRKLSAEEYLKWKAWPGEQMDVAIKAGDVIFSGGRAKLWATGVESGKELWSIPVPGSVTDLAFRGGRLFVLCESGDILCLSGSEE